MKCANFCYEKLACNDPRQLKTNVMMYATYSVRYLFNECRDPKLCITCLINGCLGVKMSPILIVAFLKSIFDSNF